MQRMLYKRISKNVSVSCVSSKLSKALKKWFVVQNLGIFLKVSNLFFKSIGIKAFHVVEGDNFDHSALRINLLFFITFINMNLSGAWIIVNIVMAARQGGSFVDAVMISSYVGFVFVSSSKILFILSKRNKLSILMQRLSQLFPKTLPQQQQYSLHDYLHNFTRLSIYFSALSMILIWLYNLFPAIQYFIINRWLKLREIDQQLPYFIGIPWDFRGHWSYYVLYASNCLAGYTASAGQTAVDMLLLPTVIQIIMHYRYVAQIIENYKIQGGNSEGATAEKNENDIKFIGDTTDYHEKILNLSDLVNDVFGLPLILNFMTSSLIICFLGFEMTIGVPAVILFKLLLYLFTSMVEVFLICWFAQELIEASEGVAKGVYNQEWYNAETRYKKMLILICARSQKTAYLKATNFLSISRGTMTDIMRVSYRFFALLRTMYAE